MWRYFLGVNLTWLFLLFLLIFWQKSPSKAQEYYAGQQALVKRFLLTDYCLSTESRHTRHLNFPELIAPFQDLPGYHEHFPSSTFLQLPNKKALAQ